MKQNMITGSPAKSLFWFAVPMVLGNLFQQFYNIADSVIVGQFVGENALAAVGASFSITMLFMCFAIGGGIGCSVVISQLLGAKRPREMKTAISTALIALGGIGFLFMLLGLAINKPLLHLMGTPELISADAAAYLAIYFYGLVFLFVYNTVSAIFNALGESKIPLYFLIFSSLLNIGLDLLFVAKFHMGIAGAAWATLIAQGISAVLALTFLLYRLSKIKTEHFRLFDPMLLKNMGKVAVPSVLQQSVVSIGMLLLQVVVNGFGATAVAGYAAATKIDSVAIVPMIAVGNAMSTFTAQNIGAQQPERVKKGYHAALLMAGAIGGAVALLLLLFGQNCVSAFLDPATSGDAIAVGTQYLKIVSVFYMFMGFMNVTNGILRGAGDIVRFMFCSLFNLTLRVSIAFLASEILGIIGIWIATPISWCAAFLFAYVCYKQGAWKKKTLI